MDSTSQDPTTPSPSPPQTTTNTYHCLCTHLLLATTHTLSSLPRRSAPGLDNALILPLPAPPSSSPRASRSRSRSASASSSSSSTGNDNDNDPNPTTTEQHTAHRTPHRPRRDHHRHRHPSKNRDAAHDQGYSVLLSATLDRKPVIVRREDGFEKRYLWRCGRCRLVVGYQVDEVHFLGQEMGRDGGGGDAGSGRRGRVVYLLPGGLVRTEEMKVGGRPVGEEGWL